MTIKTIAPASPKQELMLNIEADIVLSAGAKGSGKTFTALMIALRDAQDPNATIGIFRKQSTDARLPGSIFSEACSLFGDLYGRSKNGIKIRDKEMEIRFPNGAVLKICAIARDSDCESFKGAQFSTVIIDECSDFSLYTVSFLLSRNRSAKAKYKPRMYLLTNPSHDCFLREFIQDYYLDPKTGIPLEEKSAHIRYFVRDGGRFHWFNDRDVADTFANNLNKNTSDSNEGNGVKSFTLIPMTIYDDPILMKQNPSYLSNLLALPRVEKEKYLYGSWFAREEAASMWKREWIQIVPLPNGRAKRRVRSWDLAFTRPSEVNPNPDWTRGVLLSKDEQSIYTVEHMESLRDRVHEVENLIFETAERDGKGTTVVIPRDPNAAAGAYARDLQRRLAERGFRCKLVPPVVSKMTRFAPFASVTQAGFVHVVEGAWNSDFFEELENFDGSRHKKDDQVDVCSDAFFELNSGARLPTSFVMSDFTQSPQFGFQDNSIPSELVTRLN
jgi:predicted phage terminase large subunit-like protein